MKTFKVNKKTYYKIPGFITKSSLVVLATVLVACPRYGYAVQLLGAVRQVF